ncbi:MAG TPA: cupin domain-containing protein [Bryobacteraceae bacterium]|nr:cupin domain-containing protein [Bryobacteraceae bacterium]
MAVVLAGAASALGQSSQATTSLASEFYPFDSLAVRGTGASRSRAVLRGKNRKGMTVEAHHTELAAGSAPHPAHRHVHEEMIVVREGLMEVTIAGKVMKLGPGGVAYIASNDEHGWRNAGDTQAHYIVITLGIGDGA